MKTYFFAKVPKNGRWGWERRPSHYGVEVVVTDTFDIEPERIERMLDETTLQRNGGWKVLYVTSQEIGKGRVIG